MRESRAHGCGKERAEDKAPSQSAVARRDELEITVFGTFLGASISWLSTGAWKSPAPAVLFACVRFLDVASPSCFLEMGSGTDVSAGFVTAGSRGGELSLYF